MARPASLSTEAEAAVAKSDDAPFPLVVCWGIWIALSIGLWALLLRPFLG